MNEEVVEETSIGVDALISETESMLNLLNRLSSHVMRKDGMGNENEFRKDTRETEFFSNNIQSKKIVKKMNEDEVESSMDPFCLPNSDSLVCACVSKGVCV